jgi:hypothetical protein
VGPGSLRVSSETMDKDNTADMSALAGVEEMRCVEDSNIILKSRRNNVALEINRRPFGFKLTFPIA